ncbi:clan AA aspartic protease (TIGR02281 family) [Rhodopseudomonas thermotolerans]|uniref:Clan AA aspartic protease (TIGR02281 family) n=2 Tax=Rhodopseudomonas TaxID=1073 RepID=A0A336JT41_9BRAD|nr:MULTISPECIES: TIGR02281 family clan AA aspartic protease [Rhodopseudomonas]RED27289.1 clan AA aspartic protease (TIGR02281 family) [Rhodopseudomonas pentothenatexigens]REF91098.1 clan AA aspartic protease (TIGR02281 family) [Rhodopseudomonas thermotolerans]SSW92945.1 clan AA aspartic protease (TIGR02281 family) [Rhodopseudomonas pentothenatexigens]
MSRLLLVLMVLIGTAGAVVAYGDPKRISEAGDVMSTMLKKRVAAATAAAEAAKSRMVEIPRGTGGEFAVRAKVNGVAAPMVIDTGATSVVLTYETAKAAGLPLELLTFNVELETAGGPTRAARLSLDSLAIGKLVERSVPALVVPRGQMKTNLLGMSFLDRLESWEVRADQLRLRGYP